MKRLLVFIFALMLLPSVRADETKARGYAERIFDLAHAADTIQQIHDITMMRAKSELIARGVPAEAAVQLVKVKNYWETNNLSHDKLRLVSADLYVKNFSENELKQMLTFYETPVGQKTLRMTPKFLLDAMAAAEKLNKEQQAYMNAECEPILKKYGLTNGPASLWSKSLW